MGLVVFSRLVFADAEARHNRSETDDEALFYLANGHFLRAEYRLNHNKGIWGAARDGVRSKRLTEAYAKRHPEHGDAYFALGAYNYYVEIAPAFIRVIRLFLQPSWPIKDMPFGEGAYEHAVEPDDVDGDQYPYRTDFANQKLPWYRLKAPGQFIQVGQGMHRRHLLGSTSDATGAISRLISQDKQLTNRLLRAAGY